MVFKRKLPKNGSKKSSREDENKRSHLIKVKIPIEEITLGMQIAELDRPWTDVPVLFQGFPLQDPEDLETLSVYCNHIYIEVDEAYWESIKHNYPKSELAKPKTAAELESESLHNELPRAKKIYEASHQHLTRVMDAVKNDTAIDLEESRALVSQCVTSILANPNAMFWLSRIKSQDEYTAEHCLRVSIMAIAFGKVLNFTQAELELIGLAGMLHDVGKMKVPNSILNKPDRLTPDEFKLMQEHSVLGYIFLKQHGGIEDAVCDVAHSHHERIDGKGYPRQLNASAITLFSKVIAIVDAYDAITSDRVYKKGLTPLEALGILFKERDSHFDRELVEKFIQMVGIYPPGSLVEMTNGETGIILAANTDQKLKPKIEIILDAEGNFRRPIVIDLTKEQYDSDNNLYAIKKPLRDSAKDIDLNYFVKTLD
ncbi:MAG: HD-GYP domain-containing protein [Kangiellaceae bacterium]|nr:HD-GYP domain-containing protein [Kangiellaceae bacterium]